MRGCMRQRRRAQHNMKAPATQRRDTVQQIHPGTREQNHPGMCATTEHKPGPSRCDLMKQRIEFGRRSKRRRRLPFKPHCTCVIMRRRHRKVTHQVIDQTVNTTSHKGQLERQTQSCRSDHQPKLRRCNRLLVGFSATGPGTQDESHEKVSDNLS